MWNDEGQRAITVPLFGGLMGMTIHEYLGDEVDFHTLGRVVEFTMRVLARHVTKRLVNDPERPVEPWPEAERPAYDPSRPDKDDPATWVIEARCTGPDISVRALGEEIARELARFPFAELSPEVRDFVGELSMGILARDIGLSLEPDVEWTPEPLP